MRFWDSSAVVPLVVEQTSSRKTDAWLNEDRAIVLWTLTPVEVVSALRRLAREGVLDADVALFAEARVDQLLAGSHIVIDVESVKARARRLLRVHALRAADALQLGAAIEWGGGHPGGRILCTLDDRLAHAARLEGFDVTT